ncbi:hypothetical protein E2C01_089639 [Portunus trituberculatus]|uniref:Uncharacterized protein n=1 Tax=Portunus trituberculatus TaxID=210409 RepID=A0A5B7JMY9_PORTR|nr:hypothetical protein [Portunus trituberculatus]
MTVESWTPGAAVVTCVSLRGSSHTASLGSSTRRYTPSRPRTAAATTRFSFCPRGSVQLAEVDGFLASPVSNLNLDFPQRVLLLPQPSPQPSPQDPL